MYNGFFSWACRQLQTRKSPYPMLRTRPCLTLHVLYNLAVSFLKSTYIKLRWKPSGLLSYNKFATFFSISNSTSYIFSHVLPILVHNSYKGEGGMDRRLSFKPGFCMILFFIIQYISHLKYWPYFTTLIHLRTTQL